MQAVLNLTTELKLTESGKAYVVDFVNSQGRNTRTWVAVSQSKIEDGKLFVAEWLLEPRREGIGSLIKAGWKCLMGEVIADANSIGVTDTPKVEYAEAVINKGFFTVQVEGEKHRTFRFKTNRKGQTLIGLLVGQNNVTDYAWFGFVDGTTLRFWKSARYQQMPFRLPISHEVAMECFNAILGNVDEAGKRYATEYKNCSRCGAVLTTPESIALGLGPVCDGLRYGKK